jgi:hypothetical protein
MSEPTTSRNDVALEASTPEGGASLESILCTEELQRRPSRPPDYEKENSPLVKLVSALADSPNTVLQTLAETILDITQCSSSPRDLLGTCFEHAREKAAKVWTSCPRTWATRLKPTQRIIARKRCTPSSKQPAGHVWNTMATATRRP